jgi:hypothetical protein
LGRVAATLFAVCTGIEASDAEFIIVENPKRFSILNQYEQPLSASEKLRLVSYAPLEIVERKATLGDQITPVMKVRFDGRTLFLQRDGDGSLIGETGDGYRRIFRHCRMIQDTMTVIRSDAVSISRRFPASGQTIVAPRGSRVFRMFAYKGRYYVKLLEPRTAFGWTSPPADAWASVEGQQATVAHDGLDDAARARIETRIEEANRAYRRLFAFFNEHTGKHKAIPSWTLTDSDSGLLYTLDGPEDIERALDESARYLANDLRTLLLGRELAVSYEPGRIAVVRRTP